MAADRVRTVCAHPVALLLPCLLLSAWTVFMTTQMHGSNHLPRIKHLADQSSIQHTTVSITVAKFSSAGGSNRRMSRSSSSGSSSTPAATGSSSSKAEVPKVALLFLARDGAPLPNEPVWRAFFEAAARLQLQPAVATAAAAAAKRVAASSIQDLVGSRTLHPALVRQKPWTYPGYQIQHGLAPGAHQRWPGMSFDQLMTNINSLRSTSYNNSSSSSSKPPAWLQFSARSVPQERAFLQNEMQRLLRLAPQRPPASRVVDHPQQQQYWENKPEKAHTRDPLKQLFIVEQAAALEARLGSTASPSRSLEASDPSVRWHWWQQQQALRGSSSTFSTRDSRQGPAHPVLAQQELFSVYVHTPDGLRLPSDSIFHGSQLRASLNTTQGYAQHVLAEAAVLLLRAALQDEANMHFVMVSDTSIPLYPPQVVWAQMMSEQRSRLDACTSRRKDIDFYRWSARLSSDYFGKQHWRKSSQWFTLTRPAALLVVADSHVRELFRRQCYTNFTVLIGRSMCVSDEHYLPSLMASYGLEAATDCKGQVSYADWSAAGWHPKTFAAKDITPALVVQMRGGHQAAGVHPTTSLPAHTTSAALLSEQTAAVAEAVGEAFTNAGVQVGAATPAAAAAAAVLRASAPAGDDGLDLPCGAAAALHAASSIFVQPQGEDAAGLNDPARARAATAPAADLSNVEPEVQYWFSFQLSWLSKDRQLGGERSSSSSRSMEDEPVAEAASMQQTVRDSGDTALWRDGAARWIADAGYVPLASHCPLFARKFTAGVVNETLAMALSCAGLGLGSWCSDQQWPAQPSRTG